MYFPITLGDDKFGHLANDELIIQSVGITSAIFSSKTVTTLA